MATVFTNKGRDLATALLAASTIKYVGWGTGTTAAAATDTALQTAAAEARTAGTQSAVTTSVTNDTYQVVAAVVATGAHAITEAGLFDASTAGNLAVRSVFSAINVSVDDSIEFTFKLQYT